MSYRKNLHTKLYRGFSLKPVNIELLSGAQNQSAMLDNVCDFYRRFGWLERMFKIFTAGGMR